MNLYEIAHVSNVTLFRNAIKQGLRIGYVDIETSPQLSAHYGNRKIFVPAANVIIPTKITSAVVLKEGVKKPTIYKWEFTGPITIDTKGEKVVVKGGGEDSIFVKKLTQHLNKFDLVIMQNGDRFDAPVIQDRVCDLKTPPIRNLITLDTLKLSRRSFVRNSHKLDDRSRRFNYGGKIKQEMEDAILTMLGDKKRSSQRILYNVKDVVDLRQIFWRELNYYSLPQSIINLLLLYVKDMRPYCVKCAARHQKRYEVKEAVVYFKSGKKQKRLQCQRCFHHWPITIDKRL